MGVGPTYSGRGLSKHLRILPIPSVYLYSLMFVVNNLDKFQLNNSVHGINTRNKEHLHRLVTHLSAYQSVYYTGVRLVNRQQQIFLLWSMTKIFLDLHCVVIFIIIIIIIIYLSSVDPYIGSKNEPVDIEHVKKYKIRSILWNSHVKQ
jgi:hypothetical protein